MNEKALREAVEDARPGDLISLLTGDPQPTTQPLRIGSMMTIRKYKKKPVVVEAAQLVGTTAQTHAIYQWIEANTDGSFEPLAVLEGKSPAPKSGVSIDPATGFLLIATLEGIMRAEYGDYIIRGIAGEFYPCKPDIFEQTYGDHNEQG